MIKTIQAVDRALTRVVNIALVTLFSVMMTLAFVQVCLRYFFNNSILWGDTAARTLVIWVGFLAAVICFFLGQASVTFLSLDPETRTFLDIPIFIVELIIPAGFYLMMIRFVLRMAFNLIEIFQAGSAGQDAGTR